MSFGSTRPLPGALGLPAPRRRRRFLFLLLLLPLLGGLLVTPTATVFGDELEDAQAEQARIEQEIAAQQKAVAELNAMQEKLRGAIDQTSAALEGINADLVAVRASIDAQVVQIGLAKARYDSLVIDLALLDAHLAELQRQEEAKRAQLAERKAMLADRLRAAYDGDRVTLFELFLSGNSFADVLAEVGYQLDVGTQDSVLAERIVRDQETLAALHTSVVMTRRQTNLLRQETAVHRQELDRQLAALEEAKANLEALEAETETILAEQEDAYERLAANKDELEKAMQASAEARTRVAREIAELIQRQRLVGNIPSEFNGLLTWPLEGAISGEFGCSAYQGYGPGFGCEHFHNGIDIVAPCGTEIKAAGPGTVAYIGWNYADGFDPAWIVVIAHATNLKTWYAHMQPAYPGGLIAGAQVEAGQVIGYEGNTGRSTGCHLHWMVELEGQFTNPRLFL